MGRFDCRRPERVLGPDGGNLNRCVAHGGDRHRCAREQMPGLLFGSHCFSLAAFPDKIARKVDNEARVGSVLAAPSALAWRMAFSFRWRWPWPSRAMVHTVLRNHGNPGFCLKMARLSARESMLRACTLIGHHSALVISILSPSAYDCSLRQLLTSAFCTRPWRNSTGAPQWRHVAMTFNLFLRRLSFSS